jgi:hypothetical protein
MRDEEWRVVDQQLEELPPVVPDDWGSVLTTSKYLPWISVDELLVESLGLTKAYDTLQSYSQLQIFLLALLDTFIIDNNMGGGVGESGRGHGELLGRDRRVVRPRPLDMSTFTTYNGIGVDHHRQTVGTLCVMVSILGNGITNISKGDIDIDSQHTLGDF